MKTDMLQHKRTLENGIRIAAGNDAIHIAPSGIGNGYVTIVVESVDGGVTMSAEEAERVVAEIQKAKGG